MATMPLDAWTAARRAANRIAGGTAAASVVKAVLAQWVAENGYRWPPPRNNPGNNAEQWAKGLGCAYRVETPNPQPSNPIVTYPTLTAGVDCYAAGLVAFTRYNTAQAFARAGSGLAFAVAVCEAGYGTRESAVRSVYAALVGPPASATVPDRAEGKVSVAGGAFFAYRDLGSPLPGGTFATRASYAGRTFTAWSTGPRGAYYKGERVRVVEILAGAYKGWYVGLDSPTVTYHAGTT